MERRNVQMGQSPCRARVSMVLAGLCFLLPACVFGRSGQSDLRLMDASPEGSSTRVSSAETWPREARPAGSEQDAQDTVLLARQKKAETQFFGFEENSTDALAYAEFPGPDVDTDIELEMASPLPTTSSDVKAKEPGIKGYKGLRRSRNPRASDVPMSVEGLVWPVIGGISSPFGMRRGRLHAGIDIRANRGTPIVASQSGQVLISARRRAYGNVIVVGHDHDVQTLYAHLIKMIVRSGQYVDQGDIIGYVGRTGRATGYHLHFETRVAGGVPQDPMRSLPERPRIQARLETSQQSSTAAN